MLKQITFRPLAAAIITACILVALSLGAQAQPTRGPLTIINNSNCNVEVCSANASGCVVAPPGNTTIMIPCNTPAISVRTCTGFRVIPLSQCISNAGIGHCCVDICFVPGFVSCTFILTINPSANACICPFE